MKTRRRNVFAIPFPGKRSKAEYLPQSRESFPSMSAVAANVAPIFILILIGWLTVKAGLFRADAGEILSDFVFKIAVPTLIFRTLAEANFHGASPFRLWLTYFAGVAVTWTVGHIVTRYVFKQDVRIAVIAGISSAFANNIFIGLPLVGRSVGMRGWSPCPFCLPFTCRS